MTITIPAPNSAEHSCASVASSTGSTPGRRISSTPAKPVSVALQRRQRTTSPRIGPASAVVNITPVKDSTVAVASGSARKA